MFSHSECFRLHDKPLSFSSPCQPGYLKRTAGASTKAQDGLTFRFQGIKIKEAQRTKERNPLVLECMCVFACTCVQVFPSLLQTCLLATMLGEWWPSTRTDHPSCQVQVTQNISYWPLDSDWMGTAGQQWVFPLCSSGTARPSIPWVQVELARRWRINASIWLEPWTNLTKTTRTSTLSTTKPLAYSWISAFFKKKDWCAVGVL